jgi:hypothetical protein
VKTLKAVKEENKKKKSAADWRKKNPDYQRKYARRQKIIKLLADYDEDWQMSEKDLITALEALFEKGEK